ncbi:hypothetical protein DRP98_05155 [candidate division KSB1 bacterium]|nr:MAG: hypothetical protein DRP98_05155 [candidate division KSB1 bacterium]
MTELTTPSTGEINIGRWLSQSWNLIWSHLADFLVVTILFVAILALASSLGGIGFYLVWGPLCVGFFELLFRMMRQQSFQYVDLFNGFRKFLPAVLASILISVFFMIGLTFLVIPGLVVLAWYQFTFAFILEKDLDFWQAMEASRKLATERLFEMLTFVIVQGVVLLIGVLSLGVGILVAIPLNFAMLAFAYRDLVGLNQVSSNSTETNKNEN